jgi:hypothetical protein
MVARYDKDWNGPQGSDDMGKDKLTQGKGPFKAPEWRSITPGQKGPAPDLGDDISRKVDKAAQVDDGFSGKLPSGD